jgi:imidazoleglycerol-phosphate dehydratase
MSRSSTQSRKTAETNIQLSLDLDGSGVSTIDTGHGFFDHMLTLFSRHSLIDLKIKTVGDLHIDAHHTVEDTAIVLGDALREALGTKAGISRYGHAYLPMDETLARVVIDLSNRPFLEFRTPLQTASAPNFPLTLTEEFAVHLLRIYAAICTSSYSTGAMGTTLLKRFLKASPAHCAAP